MIQLIAGFCLIQWMDKADYAAYTLIIAILSSAAGFLNMGLSQPLAALVGKKVDDPIHVGRCIASSRYYRDRLMLIGVFVLFFVLWLSSEKIQLSTMEWLCAWVAVVFTLYFQYWSGVYSVVFKLQRNLKPLYTLGAVAGGTRFGLVVVSYLGAVLGAPIAISCGGAQAFINGVGMRWMTKGFIKKPSHKGEYESERRELMSQCLPRLPSSIYHNISGQISIFLIGYFGTTMAIAEIGALRRIGMLFLIYTAAGKFIVSPYFATVDKEEVLPRMLVLMSGAAVFSFVFSTVCFLFPEPFLWILGDGYQHLRFALFLVVLTGCTKLVGDYFLDVILARKYVFKWFSFADVVPHIIVMVFCIIFYDLSDIRGVLYLGLTVHGVRTISNLLIMVYGISRELKAVSSGDAGE